MTAHKEQKKTSGFLKIDALILGTILVIALIFRLYKISIPLADWHSWRQADTAAVARNLTKNFDLLHPKYDDLSNIQSGKDNPQGLRLVEFPFYNGIFGTLYRYLPLMPVEIYGRFTTIFFSLILIAIIYYFAIIEFDRVAAIFSALTFAVFPFFVYYSRVVLPEMTAVSLSFLSIFFLYLFISKSGKNTAGHWFTFIIAALCSALSLLVKPTVIFYLIPTLYLFYKKNGFIMFRTIWFYLFFIITLVPLSLWRIWIAQFPMGIPASDWLIFAVNTPQGLQNIFLRPAFFRWIFFERILNLILGGYLVVFLIAGVIRKPKKSFLFYSLGIAAIVYLFIFEGGNVQHDYYQAIILPVLALFVGAGASFITTNKSSINIFLSIPITITLFIFSFFFSYYQVKNYYNYNADTVNIAKIIQSITSPQDNIVTDTEGDTTLLYLSERRGYPAVTEDLHKLKAKGLTYFVTTKSDIAEKVKKEFEMIFASDKVFIFKL